MTDTAWLGVLFLSVALGSVVFGLVIHRILKRAYGLGSDRPRGTPPKHGVDRRVPNE